MLYIRGEKFSPLRSFQGRMERFYVKFKGTRSKRTPAHGLSILGATVHKVEKSKVSEFAQILHTSSNLHWDIPQKILANYLKGFRSY